MMFRKSQMRSLRQTNMSIQKDNDFERKSQNDNKIIQPPPQVVVHSNTSYKVHTIVKDGIAEQGSPDVTLLWKGTIPTIPGQRMRNLVFKNIQFILSGWSGDGFPSVLYIGVDGLEGYRDSTLTKTNRAAALQLSTTNVVYDQSDVRTYQLKYVLRDQVTWEIPTKFNDFKIRIYIDDSTTAVVLPLPNPLTLSFEVRMQ